MALGNVWTPWGKEMYQTLSAQESLRSKKNVMQRGVPCGLNGPSGHNAQLLVVVEDDREVENVQRQLSGMGGTFVMEVMTMKKKLAMKM